MFIYHDKCNNCDNGLGNNRESKMLILPITTAYLHFFVVKREAKPFPIVFCQPYELSDYHTLGLYSLRLFHETTLTHYIVP